MVYVIIPTTNLVCVFFDPVIPTSSFNYIKMFFILVVFIFLSMILPMLVCKYVPVRDQGHVYDVMSCHVTMNHLCARMLI